MPRAENLGKLRDRYPQAEISFFQSDDVGALANAITTARNLHGIILNAGAYTHTSMVLADAVRTAQCPVVEVHISNLFGREQYRRKSVLSSVCSGFISGFGLDGYELALLSFLRKNVQDVKLYPV